MDDVLFVASRWLAAIALVGLLVLGALIVELLTEGLQERRDARRRNQARRVR